MKKNIYLLFLCAFSFHLFAQQDTTVNPSEPKVKEFGLGFSSLTAYSLQYRWGNTKRLFRINATLAGSSSFGDGSGVSNTNNIGNSTIMTTSTTKTNTPLNFNTGLSFSILHFKYLIEKFGIMCGPAIGVSYSVVNNRSNQTGTNATSSSGNYPRIMQPEQNP